MMILFLFLSFILIITVWLIYYRMGRSPNLIALLSPGIIAIGVIVTCILSLTIPLDTRLVEYSAIALRHYPIWEEEIRPKHDSVESYPVEHHEYYAMMYYENPEAKKKDELEIPEATYVYYKKLWGDRGKKAEVSWTSYDRDFHRHWWDGDMYNSMVYTKSEPYWNYFKNILPLYNLGRVKKEDIEKFDLVEYAGITSVNSENILEPRQTLIYGLEVPDSISRACSFLSTVDHKFRPILIVWVGRGMRDEMIKKQRSYWEGGKDNEVVFCVSINDTIQKKILWSGSFSWAQNDDFEDYVLKSALHPGESLDMIEYISSVREGYKNGLWQPRDFSSYSIAKLPSDYFIYIFTSMILIVLDCLLICLCYSNSLKKKD